MMAWIHNKAAWRKGCNYGCRGRKARCVLPFRKSGRGSRKCATIEKRRGAFHWNLFRQDTGWRK